MVLFCGVCYAAEPGVQEIVRRSVTANNADFNALPNYSYREVDVADDSPSKTYEVRMIGGSPYNELIASGGQPLPAQEKRREQRKIEETIERRNRETPGERAGRIAKYRSERKEERTMLQQMVDAFNFRLAGEGTLAGHAVYILDAEPRPGYHPPNLRARVLKGMRGRLWIDRQSFHWVKVEAEVVSPVSIEGFLARVDPGTRFVLEKAPVGGDVWLPSHFHMDVAAKILGIFGHNSMEDERYSDYQRATTVASAGK